MPSGVGLMSVSLSDHRRRWLARLAGRIDRMQLSRIRSAGPGPVRLAPADLREDFLSSIGGPPADGKERGRWNWIAPRSHHGRCSARDRVSSRDTSQSWAASSADSWPRPRQSPDMPVPLSIDDASHPGGPHARRALVAPWRPRTAGCDLPGVPHRAAFGIWVNGDGGDVDQPGITNRSRE